MDKGYELRPGYLPCDDRQNPIFPLKLHPMLIYDLKDCEPFIAGDKTILRQLLHPDKHPVACRYSLAHATVKPGDASTEHVLRTTEIYFILSGSGEMHIGDEVAQVGPGQLVYIPPEKTQHIRNIGNADLTFLCVVDPAWREEDERVLE